MNNIAFEIPGLRLKGGLNAREHWRARASRVAKERKLAGLFFREAWAKVPNSDRILPMVVLLTRVGPRLLDDDNVVGSFKSVRDSIAQEMGIDDKDKRVHWHCGQETGRFGVKVQIYFKSTFEQRVVSA